MKLFCTLFVLICAFTTQVLVAQAPLGFSYQAVARDINDNIIKDELISMRFWIIADNAAGSPVYRETHNGVYTGINGVITRVIGTGTQELGSFEAIDWGSKNYFIRVDMDVNGGSNFTQMGTSQLLSVPYAMFAQKAGNSGSGSNDNWGTQTVQTNQTLIGDGTASNPLRVDISEVNTDNQVLNLNGNQLSISNGNTVSLPAGSTLTAGSGINISNNVISNTGDNDNNPTNEIQQLSLSGTVLSLSNNGGSVNLPSSGGGDNWGTQTVVNDGITLSGQGTASSPLAINHQNVSNGQVLKSNGTTWIPGTDNDNQDLSNTTNNSDVTIQISGGTSTTFSVNDNDSSPTNEIQQLSLSGTVLSLSNNGGSVNLPSSGSGDNWGTQTAVSDGTTLSGNGTSSNPMKLNNQNASNGQVLKNNGTTWVPGADNDNQNLSISGTNLSIANGNTVALPQDGDGSSTNELQNLSKSQSGSDITLNISNGTGTTFSVNDNDSSPTNELQDLSKSQSGSDITLNISNGTGTTFSINDNDSSPTNELQSLSVSGTNLSISNGNTVPLPNGLWSKNPQFLGIHYLNEVSVGTQSVFGELNVNGRGVFFNDVAPAARTTINDNGTMTLTGTNGKTMDIGDTDHGKIDLFRNNKRMVILGSDQFGGLFQPLDNNGNNIASLWGAQNGGGELEIRKNNVQTVLINTNNDGGLVRIFNKTGSQAAEMSSKINGDGRLLTFKDNGAPSVLLSTNANGGTMSTFNSFGNEVIDINASSIGGGRIATKSLDSQFETTTLTTVANNSAHGFIQVLGNGVQKAGMFSNPNTGNGEIFATGTKNFRMDYPGRSDKEIWYASLEGPEAGAYERGTSELVNGEATISFSDHFELVITQKGMTVMLTPLSGESLGLAVIEKTDSGFKVKELHGGKGNYSFDWEAKGVRAGFERYEVIRDKSDALPANFSVRKE